VASWRLNTRPGSDRMAVPRTEAPGVAGSVDEIRLPLVSVIVTAHNYGRFLPAALGSVLGQSYRDLECIVVDDGSSDETPRVLERAAGSIRALRNPTPLGQGAASRIGFEASSGQYVVFMDADDMLDPHFVRDHVFVNLSSRVPVGMTSSDIYQIVDGRLVLGTGEALNAWMLGEPAASQPAFRPLGREPDGRWPFDGPDSGIVDGVRHVPPGRAEWRWSPMTGNMFRRDALTLLLGSDRIDRLPLSTDVYLCTGASVLCGSLLIDKSLSYYRLHGRNSGVFQAQLVNTRSVRPESELSMQARRLLIEHLVVEADAICARLSRPDPLLAALAAIDATLEADGAPTHVAPCLADHGAALAAIVGEGRLQPWRPRPSFWRRISARVRSRA